MDGGGAAPTPPGALEGSPAGEAPSRLDLPVLDQLLANHVAQFGEMRKPHAPDPATTPLHAVYAPGPYVAPKVRAMIAFLTARFGAETEWDGGFLS